MSGGEAVFDEDRHRSTAWLVGGALLLAAGVLLMVAMTVAIIAEGDPVDIGALGALALATAMLGVPGLLVLGNGVLMRNRGVVVSQHGVKRALAGRHPWVPWHEIRSVTVTDHELVMETAPGQSPIKLGAKAANFVVLPALVRPLLPPDVPWDWRLEMLRPGGPRPGGTQPRWKTVDPP